MTRLLIAEDDSVNQQVLLRLLTKRGQTAVVVNTGLAALQAVQATLSERRGYDLIFMDMQMPELDGTSATQAIRALPLTFPPYIVGISSDTVVSVGLDATFAKPFKIAHLSLLLDRYLAPYCDTAILASVMKQYGKPFTLSMVQTFITQMETYPAAIAAAALYPDPQPLLQLSQGLQAAGQTLGARALVVAIEHLMAATPQPPLHFIQRLTYQVSGTREALQLWLASQ